MDLQIPPGVERGQRLRVDSAGPAGSRGAPNGDLYVLIDVVAHPEYERRGTDLLTLRRVSITQVALGAVLNIETLDGDEQLVIPPGTQPGKVFVLRGRGVPALGGRGRGDIHVHVDVEIPKKLTEAEDTLLRQLAEIRGDAVAPRDANFLSKIKSAFQ